jgi:MoxR-like ATPase
VSAPSIQSPATVPETDDEHEQAHAAAAALVRSVCEVVRGAEPTVRLLVCALLAGGHALVQDLPGTGKTTMARALARAVGGSYARVQATVDLVPGDVTGSGVWTPSTGGFSFVPGPVFVNVLLVDELNRTSPRTQSAFMEAMDEGAVTVDGVRHALPDPFFAIATQNPLDQHGTFPLPEGQLDRFAVVVGQHPLDLATELQVVREQLARPTVDDVPAVLDPAALRAVRATARTTHVSGAVLAHAVGVVRATREDPRVAQGASSRAALTLVRVAQAHAVLCGRDHVTPSDTRAVAGAVLAHRLVLRGGPGSGGSASGEAADVVAALLARVPVPLGS